MIYDKPKVTIDLDEYNSLIATRDGMKADESLQAHKLVIATIINARGDIHSVSSALRKADILFSVNMASVDRRTSGVMPDDILISKIKTNQQ